MRLSAYENWYKYVYFQYWNFFYLGSKIFTSKKRVLFGVLPGILRKSKQYSKYIFINVKFFLLDNHVFGYKILRKGCSFLWVSRDGRIHTQIHSLVPLCCSILLLWYIKELNITPIIRLYSILLLIFHSTQYYSWHSKLLIIIRNIRNISQ